MRNLTQEQQDVIDLMNTGWELAVDMTIHGRNWLQKGGAGRGGEAQNVRATTVRTLLYLGFIEVAESKFPTKTYRIKKEAAVTKEVRAPKESVTGGTLATHPSFGIISFARGHGTGSALFGSSIEHNNVIIVQICHAEKHIDGGVERAFGRGIIVEAVMSPTQFADAITGFGQGGGTPVTLRRTEKEGSLPRPVLENKRVEFEAEFEERTASITQRIDETIAKAKDKNAPQWLVKEIEILKGWMTSNIPFLAEQFSEQMERSVVEAKGEIEAYVRGMVEQTGIDALEEMAPQLRLGQSKEVPDVEK